MPLDPKVRAFLDLTADAPPLDTLPVPDARAGLLALAAMQGAGEPIAHVADHTIPGPAGEIPVRLYAPGDPGPLPVLVYFHGGGWVVGGLETHDGICRALANRLGGVVVSVDYRLAPEHPFPAAPEDCYAATQWIAAHAAELRGDPARLSVGGDSAGGNLAAVVSLMARDRGGPRLRHQLLVYPVTDASFDTPSYRENAEGYFLTHSLMTWFWDHYCPPAERAHPHASPLRAPDLRGLPPACVITAEYDPLRDEGEAYAARLKAAGVPVELRRYDGIVHGFFGMSGMFAQAGEALAQAAAAISAAHR